MKKVIVAVLVLTLVVLTGTAMAQQAAAPATAPTATVKAVPAMGLNISRMEIAGSVENREPVGVAATFPATQEKVYCFLEFQNVSQETSVTVVWTLGQNEMGSVPLAVKAYSKYRTWANKTIAGMKGDWKVEIKDKAGAVLKSATFKIQ
jgi:hypothetical protein